MGYGLRLVTPPTDEPLTVAEAKAHCHVAESFIAHDATFESLIASARTLAEERIGRQLMLATWELVIDRFPWNGRALHLPRPPLVDVVSVQYIDPSGQLRTWDDDLYVVSTAREPGRLSPLAGVGWPSTASQADAVTIRYQCGYATPDSVPSYLRHALKLLVAHWFVNREAVGTIAKEIAFSVESMFLTASPGDEFTCYGPES